MKRNKYITLIHQKKKLKYWALHMMKRMEGIYPAESIFHLPSPRHFELDKYSHADLTELI